MANGSSYLRLTSRYEGLNVGENFQAKLDLSAGAVFTTSDCSSGAYKDETNKQTNIQK